MEKTHHNVISEDGPSLHSQPGFGFVSDFLDGTGNRSHFRDTQIRNQVTRVAVDENEDHQTPDGHRKANWQRALRYTLRLTCEDVADVNCVASNQLKQAEPSGVRLWSFDLRSEPTERQVKGHDANEEQDPDVKLKRTNWTPKSTLFCRVLDQEPALIVLHRNGEIEVSDPLDGWDESVSVEVHILNATRYFNEMSLA